MKVLVLSGATYGDPSTRRVFDHLAAKGADILLVLPSRIKHAFAPSEAPDTPWATAGVKPVRLGTWFLHKNGTHIIMKGVPALMRDFSPDIVHCALEPWSITCLEALAVAGLSRRRPVFGVQAAESLLDQGGALAASIRKALFRQVVSRCDYFVGWNSRVIAAASRLGLNGAPCCVAPAVGTDTTMFRPSGEGEKAGLRIEMGLGRADDFVVGFVGRFVKEKGIEDLITAMEGVVAGHPRATLSFVGAGPLEPVLRQAAASRPWLRIAGSSGRSGIARFMRAIDLLVLPSRTTASSAEQFGLVLVEAMSSGVPVVGSTCGAIPEVVGDGGWIVRESDPAMLRECIERAMDNADELAARGRKARERAVSRYSDEAVAESLSGIWQAALGEARR